MLNIRQFEQLCRPLNEARIAHRQQGNRGKQLSYLEAWDVKAHLIRIFGYGGWSWEVLEAQHVFTRDTTVGEQKKPAVQVGYKVVGRLTIHSISQINVVGGRPDRDAVYTEAAVGFSTQGDVGEAHDMAVKTAESDALKRCAINLGDQFGLSLYNEMLGVVGGTLQTVPGMTGEQANPDQIDQKTPEVKAITDGSEPDVQTQPSPAAPAEDSEGAKTWVSMLREAAANGGVPAIMAVKKDIAKAKAMGDTFEGLTLERWVDKAVQAVGSK